jgi:Arc/MetJ-type ribon-helix-helix transcriptional regulator
MQIITINLAEPQLDALKVLTDLGIYDSRSQALRSALADFLEREIQLLEIFHTGKFKEIQKFSLKGRD